MSKFKEELTQGSHSPFQRIFPTQGLNLGLLLCRQIYYGLSHPGSPHVFPPVLFFHKVLSCESFWYLGGNTVKSGNTVESVHTHTLAFGLQFSSVAQSCLTLCDPMDCSTPGSPVHQQPPKLAQTHVHQIGDANQPSHPMSSSSPPAFNLSQHQGLFQ